MKDTCHLAYCMAQIRKETRGCRSYPVVNVDVHVQNALVNFEQLQNCQNDVVHITKPACLALLGVM